MRKPLEGAVKPIVRTAKPARAGTIVGSGALVKSTVGYAHCAIDGTLLAKPLGSWARNGLQCPKCKHITWYIKREWRGIPLVDDSTFDIARYVKTPQVESIATTITDAIESTQRAPDPEFQKSLLAKLARIARALERLADAWEGGDHSIKAES